MTLDFHDDGSVTGLTSGEFSVETLGNVTKKRYSHIWPSNRVKRAAFRVLRSLFSERGRVAQWCRSWRCTWEVRLVGSENVVRYASQSRAACIEWESRNLNGD